MKIKPLGERVLLKRIEEDEQVRGGIIIPDSAKEKSQEAEVVALGTGKKDENGKVIPLMSRRATKFSFLVTVAHLLKLMVLNTFSSKKIASSASSLKRFCSLI